MATFCGDVDAQGTINAAAIWKENCLVKGGSLFSDNNLWNLENIKYFEAAFKGNLLKGKEKNFLEKLETQVSGLSSDTKMFVAELIWLLHLCCYRTCIGPARKREKVLMIWSWSGGKLDPSHPLLSNKALLGVGHPGAFYLPGLWRDINYYLEVFSHFFSLEEKLRLDLLKNGWSFSQWIEVIDGTDSRQSRHMLVFMLFPELFERCFSDSHRRQIVEAFGTDLKSMNQSEIDRALFEIRKSQVERLETEDLDFYNSPLYEVWNIPDQVEEESESYSNQRDGRKERFKQWLKEKYTKPKSKVVDSYLRAIELLGEMLARDIYSIDLGRELDELIEDVLKRQKEENGPYSLEESQSYGRNGYYSAALNNYQEFLMKGNLKIIDFDQPTNLIFYGPPGTGKTYNLYKDYIDQYVDRAVKMTEQEWLRYNLDGLSWLDVLALSLLDLGGGPVKVADLQEHRFLREYLSVLGGGPKNVRASIWGMMQAHTDADCEHVKVAVRRSPSWFVKGADSQWSFSDDWLESGSEISELLTKINAVPQVRDNEDRKRYEFVTFHQSYSYEEFVEGIRPVLSSDENDNEVRYELHKGIFREICEKAERDKSGKRYAIFIDEINRGNISKIFGELITLIEKDKRAGCEGVVPLKLPYSKQDFSVPKNLDIYGTMNTADRSLAYLDTALRRRFSFIEVMPDPSELASVDFDGMEVDLKALLTKINLRLESLLDREHTLGHAYLMDSGKTVEKEGLICAFREKIIPQLTDYFYEDWDKVRLVLADNQVTDRNLQFVSKGEVDKGLFGSDVSGDILQRFELNREALNNPEAYIKIYSVLGSSES